MTFPLVPRRRLIGLSFGTMRSQRRGRGSDVAGSRPYYPGDDVHAIDWAASARLASARGSDEFVVRERYADEAPRVVIVCDRGPTMSFFREPLPWLDKAAALRAVTELILDSTVQMSGFAGYLDFADGEPWWLPPRGGPRLWELRERRLGSTAFGAPADTFVRAFEYLAERPGAVTPGSFVFCLSDFLAPPPEEAWLTALQHRWDVVPVVIQDPTWEQSFPDVGGVVLPLRDARTGRVADVYVTRRRAAARREANRERLRAVLREFEALGLDPVLVSSSRHGDVLAEFFEWSDRRRLRRAA